MKPRRNCRGRAAFAAITVLLAAPCCTPFPEVIQGRVEEYDPASHSLLLQDQAPGSRQVRFSLESAEIGAEPVVGDTLRIAYREEGGVKVATRVMNITRQEEFGRRGLAKGSGGH